jgi:hypothetical protein
MKLNAFVRGYLTCALWASTDDNGETLDGYSLDDIAESSVKSAVEDCEAFQADNTADLTATEADDEQNGHDFWLTRNRHGAGFWDRGYGDVGKRLTEAAHAYGDANAYVSDDGYIYIE